MHEQLFSGLPGPFSPGIMRATDACPPHACPHKEPRHVSIHSGSVRRLAPRPTARGRADAPSLKGGVTEKGFTGFAVLSTALSP